MDLRQYLSMIGRWLWLVVLAVGIAAASSYFASKAATPLYRTKTTLMVGRATQNPNTNSMDLYTGQQLAYTYSQLARRKPVLQGAIGTLGLDMNWSVLAGQVSTNIIQQTQLLEVLVIDSDPYRAKVLADAIAQQLILQTPAAAQSDLQDTDFIQAQLDDLKLKIEGSQSVIENLQAELDTATSARQIQDLQNQITIQETKVSGWQDTYSQLLISLKGGDVNTLSVVEEASIPAAPFSPKVKMNVLIASAIGLILAVGGAFLIEYLDDTVKTPDDVERLTSLPTLGTISRIAGENYAEKLVAASMPLSPVVESYRGLRTALQFSSIDKPNKTLLMTSPGPGEGKSVTLANLAVVIAQAGINVIVVDTDLRRPVQHKIFGTPNRAGLTDAIVNPKSSVREYLQPTQVDNLSLLPSGPLPPNPAEVLGSGRMKELVEELKSEYDIILFDSPPTRVVTDAVVLATRVDGVIIVNDAGRTRNNESHHTTEELRRVHANLLGVVLNRISAKSRSYYYYGYYYSENGSKKHHKRNRRFFQQPSAERNGHSRNGRNPLKTSNKAQPSGKPQ